MSALLDVLGFVIRGVGLLVVVAFMTVAALTVWDLADALRESPRCPECGRVHGPAHRQAHDPDRERLP